VREAAIQRNHQKADMIHQSFIGRLAKEYDFEFFDGYKAFSDQSDEKITNHLWLKYDGHWGQNDSDLYAKKLSEYLIENNWPPETAGNLQ
jgi:hypothetical protein